MLNSHHCAVIVIVVVIVVASPFVNGNKYEVNDMF